MKIDYFIHGRHHLNVVKSSRRLAPAADREIRRALERQQPVDDQKFLVRKLLPRLSTQERDDVEIPDWRLVLELGYLVQHPFSIDVCDDTAHGDSLSNDLQGADE